MLCAPNVNVFDTEMLPPSTQDAEHTPVEHAFVFFLICLVMMLAWELIIWVQHSGLHGCPTRGERATVNPDNCKHVLQMD